MEKRIISLFMLMLYAMTMCYTNAQESINMQHIGNHGDHGQYYPPADMPEAYFDDVDMEIVIEAEGYADYYIVEVFSMASTQSLIYTQIDGYGDSIDVSSLPIGYYQIIITSSNNNVYEGYFLIE